MLKVALEDEQFFEIEVIRQDETDNASSKVVVPKRQKKANTMIGDIKRENTVAIAPLLVGIIVVVLNI